MKIQTKILLLSLVICINSAYHYSELEQGSESFSNYDLWLWNQDPSSELTATTVCEGEDEQFLIVGGPNVFTIDDVVKSYREIPTDHTGIILGGSIFLFNFDDSEQLSIKIDKEYEILVDNSSGVLVSCTDNLVQVDLEDYRFQHEYVALNFSFEIVNQIENSQASWGINNLNFCTLDVNSPETCNESVTWDCDGYDFAEDEFLYNGDCAATGEYIIGTCWQNFEALTSSVDTFNTTTTINQETEEIELYFQNADALLEGDFLGCLTYEVSVNGFKYKQQQELTRILEQQDITSSLPDRANTFQIIDTENQAEEMKPTVFFALDQEQILDLGCSNVSENSQTIYTCPVQFNVYGNYTIQHQELFDLVVSMQDEGTGLEASITIDISTEVTDGPPTGDVTSKLYFCGSGQALTSCQLIESTDTNPQEVIKNQPITLRHVITSSHSSTKSLEVTSLKLGPITLTSLISYQSTGKQGYVDFSFSPVLQGTLVKISITSIVRDYPNSSGDETEATAAEIKFNVVEQSTNDNFDLVTDNTNNNQDIQGSDNIVTNDSTPAEGSSSTLIVVIVVLSVVLTGSVVGGAVYIKSAMNAKKMSKSSKYEQNNLESQEDINEKYLTGNHVSKK